MTVFYKILVLDIDGTLLDSSHNLPTENLNALKDYQAAGGTVVLATGKLYNSMEDLCRKMDLNTPQIIGNGYALVSPDGQLVECMGYLTREQVEKGETIFQQAGLNYVYYGTQSIWYERSKVEKCDLEKLTALGEVEPTPLSSDEINRLDKVIKLLAFCEDCDEEETARAGIRERKDIRLFRSSYQFIEIARSDVDKGVGLKSLLELLNVDKQQVVAMGDNENDLALFHAAGLAVAMGQSTQEVKEKADVVTASNDDNGVAQFVYEYLLRKS